MILESGDKIPIEQRAASEVTHVFGVPVAPEGTAVQNPAFAVTPNRYVTAIITERGVARAPYEESLKELISPQRRKGQRGNRGGSCIRHGRFSRMTARNEFGISCVSIGESCVREPC